MPSVRVGLKGWMWCDASKNNIYHKITDAILAYFAKHKHKPDICHVHEFAPGDLEILLEALGGTLTLGDTSIETAPNIPLNHFLLGMLPYHLAYQSRDAVVGKHKKGKVLDTPLIHIMHDGAGICGVSPVGETVERGGVVEVISPGVKLIRIEESQVVEGMEWCYHCSITGKQLPVRIKRLIDGDRTRDSERGH